MNRQSASFGVVLLLTSIAVGSLVYFDRTGLAIAAGVAGLLLQWWASRGDAENDEVSDSSYFFGFILTLVFLAAGLYKLGLASESRGRSIPGQSTAVASKADEAGGGAPSEGTELVLSFLEDLAAGLSLTIVGLTIRQVRALGVVGDKSERSLLVAQSELTRNLGRLVDIWRDRPEQQVLEQLKESKAITHDATVSLQADVAAAGQRMLAASADLETATAKATQAITRAAAAVSESVMQTTERLEVEVGKVLVVIQDQRSQAQSALAAAQKEGAALRSEADAHLKEHMKLWEETVARSREALTTLHQGLSDEYARGLAGFSASGRAFADLTTQTVGYVQSLPNPATTLSGLWQEIATLETNLKAAVEGSVRALTVLSQHSDHATAAFDNLRGSATAASQTVGSTSEAVRQSLQRELSQMNQLVDEYVRLLHESTRSLRQPG